MAHLCVVSPDLPDVNDVTRQCDALARLWARGAGQPVTLLLAGRCPANRREALREAYAAAGVRFCDLAGQGAPAYPRPGIGAAQLGAQTLHDFLCQQAFDLIVFADAPAPAYVVLQAKRTGLAFARTALGVVLHGPSRWQRQRLGAASQAPLEELKLDFMEAWCVAHADFVASYTAAMVDWAQAAGWALPAQRQLLPPLWPPAGSCPGAPVPLRAEALTYLGPLTPADGLHAFARALRLLVDDPAAPELRRVTFLGPDNLDEVRRRDPLLQALLQEVANRGVEVAGQLAPRLGPALERLQKSGAIAVVPALQCNAPGTVLGCVAHGIPLLTSQAPGIAPFVGGDACLDVAAPHAFAAALRDRAARVATVEVRQDRATAEAAWLAALRRAAHRAAAPPSEVTVPVTHRAPADVTVAPPLASAPSCGLALAVERWPRLSVCVPYYNKGAYLPETLASLAAARYPGLEVIVVDDGSNVPADLAVLAEMEATYAAAGWRFVRQKNQGLGTTRNAAARLAQGEYLLFFDADDVAVPTMLHDFARAMVTSQADCMTCYYVAFDSQARARGAPGLLYGYVPVGPCWQAGIAENVFGGANFCVRKEVFWTLGGFTSDRLGCEDWEFLARLTLQGYRQEVLPKEAFYYRKSLGSMTQTMDITRSFARGIRPYTEASPAQWSLLLRDLFIPMYDGQKQAGQRNAQLLYLLKNLEARRRGLEQENQQLRAELLRLRRRGECAAPALRP